jgi:hypothetical protein
MNWLDGDLMVTPTEAFQQWRLCFLCDPCRGYIPKFPEQLEAVEKRIGTSAVQFGAVSEL